LYADTVEEVFAELARILAEAAGPIRTPRVLRAWEHVELEARDQVALLVDWANELIGRSEVAGRAYGDVRNLIVESRSTRPARLVADVRGEPVDEWVSPVKAATYHGATLDRKGSGWRAVVLFDV
jgi:SHS2 domain-containing protein